MQVAERVADAGKALPDGVFLHLHIMQLPVVFQQGQSHCQPPRRCDEERDVQRRHLAQADGPGPQHQRQADYKGHTAADVAPRIPAGGDYVHPVRGGDIAQHRIIEHQTAGKAHLRKDEDEQEGQPGLGHAHGAAAGHAHHQAEDEDGLFEAPRIGQCAEDGAQHRRDDGHSRSRIAPVCQIFHGAQAAFFRQSVEKDGDERRHQQHKGRVADIV